MELANRTIARELQDAEVRVLVRRKLCGIHLQTAFGGLHHGGDVKGVLGVVVNLQRDIIPAVAGDFVTCRAEREVRQNRLFGLVMKVTPSFLLPFFLKYPGRDSNLIGAGAVGDLELGAAVYAVTESFRI